MSVAARSEESRASRGAEEYRPVQVVMAAPPVSPRLVSPRLVSPRIVTAPPARASRSRIWPIPARAPLPARTVRSYTVYTTLSDAVRDDRQSSRCASGRTTRSDRGTRPSHGPRATRRSRGAPPLSPPVRRCTVFGCVCVCVCVCVQYFRMCVCMSAWGEGSRIGWDLKLLPSGINSTLPEYSQVGAAGRRIIMVGQPPPPPMPPSSSPPPPPRCDTSVPSATEHGRDREPIAIPGQDSTEPDQTGQPVRPPVVDLPGRSPHAARAPNAPGGGPLHARER